MCEIIEISIIISLCCLGFRAITDKDMILYFLRKPFDLLDDRKKDLEEHLETNEKKRHDYEGLIQENINMYGDDYKNSAMYKEHRLELIKYKAISVLSVSPDKHNWIIYTGKPLITCVTCMASIHTLIWFPILTGEINLTIIPTMLIVAFINSFMWNLLNLIKK